MHKSVEYFKDHIGNLDILKNHKTAFLCSRKISAGAVLKCYDWAIEQREAGRCVISGFHSPIEKDVFHYLLKGKQPIILALARGIPNRMEPDLKVQIEIGRLLVITPFAKTVKRVSKETALIRNKLMVLLGTDIVIGYQDPNGELFKVIKNLNKNITYLTQQNDKS